MIVILKLGICLYIHIVNDNELRSFTRSSFDNFSYCISIDPVVIRIDRPIIIIICVILFLVGLSL